MEIVLCSIGELGYKSRSRIIRLEVSPHRFDDIANIISTSYRDLLPNTRNNRLRDRHSGVHRSLYARRP